jgi:hypothetical protein
VLKIRGNPKGTAAEKTAAGRHIALLKKGDIWYKPPSPVSTYFSGKQGQWPDPMAWCLKPIFWWAIHHSHGVFPCCPKCRRPGSPKGWQSNPPGRWIYTAHGTVVILSSYDYYCYTDGCATVTFLGSQPLSVAQLPFCIRSDFLFILTYKAGATRELVESNIQHFLSGVGPTPEARILSELGHQQYGRDEASFYSVLSVQKDRWDAERPAWSVSANPFDSKELEPFPEINSVAYHGKTPSGELSTPLHRLVPFNKSSRLRSNLSQIPLC